ncbi:hypothetical protein RGQ15_22035 [Paracoccus sp. MBLB3053]|uniref:Uncharacterized protein n=1 Tax=Paracoccus aurantius TaxID=3073814 RepID=A0ABU2I041_9RHOB|nr:hypothetical protein [Paracoccus sp. MBLB3053]MDS9470229.1 hypothetical protein [Paracoccus sp. MBLB3053]
MFGQGVHITGTCLPPEEPFVPEDDTSLAQYAGLIAEDFESYFAASSEYFACMDVTRKIEFDRARQVSERHRQFLDRLDRLGLRAKAALGQEP